MLPETVTWVGVMFCSALYRPRAYSKWAEEAERAAWQGLRRTRRHNQEMIVLE